MMPSPGIAVIKRELLSGLRDPRPALFLALFLAVLIVGLLLLLEVVYAGRLARTGVIDAQFVSQLFTDFSKALYGSALLLVPPLAAVSICTERQQDSFDLLRMTYISPIALASAKLTNVLGLYLLTAIATLPFVGVAFFLIGVDWTQFLLNLYLILWSAASLSVIGLLCSARFHRTLPAIVYTYVLGYAAHGGLLLAIGLFTELLAPYSHFSYWLDELPGYALALLSPIAGINRIGEGGLGLKTALFIGLYHGSIVVVGTFLVVRTLKRPYRPSFSEAPRPIRNSAQLDSRRWQFPYYLFDPRRPSPLIPDGANPIRVRDARLNSLSHGTGAARLFCGFAFFSFLVSLMCMDLHGQYNRIGVMAGWAYLYVTVFILLLTPSLVATAIAREWEWQNVEGLRATLLTGAEVFRGKLLNALSTALIPCAGALVGSFPLYIFGRDGLEVWRMSAMAFLAMLVCVLYAISVSLWATTSTRTSLTALLSAYGACVFCLLLTGPTALILARASLARVFAPANNPSLYYFLSPLTALYSVVEHGNAQTPLYSGLFWLANCTLFLGLSTVLIQFASRRFQRQFMGS